MAETTEIIMSVMFMTIIASIAATFLGGIICIIKNEVTCRNHLIISKAIADYHVYLIRNGMYNPNNEGVTYNDMEDYNVTLKRFWDWGYKRILPPEKFELIKPFIRRGKAVRNDLF